MKYLIIIVMLSLINSISGLTSCKIGQRIRPYIINLKRIRTSSSPLLRPVNHHCHQTRLQSQQTNNANDNSSLSLPQSWTPLTSTQNPTIKHFQSLLTKKKSRKQHNQTVIEGHRLVIDLLTHPRTHHLVQHILLSEDTITSSPLGSSLLRQILSATSSPSSSVTVNLVTPSLIKSLSDTMTPQGILATISLPSSAIGSRDELEFSPSSSQFYLILDGISDPGNLGTLLRTAAATNVTAVILLPDVVDPYGPKAIRSGMGATFLVPLIVARSVKEGVEHVTRGGGVVYAASMEREDSVPYWDVDWVKRRQKMHDDETEDGDCSGSGSVALVVGKEGSGLSEEMRGMVKEGEVRGCFVPMEGGSVESLNAAVCGSVVMFEYYRQLNLKDR